LSVSDGFPSKVALGLPDSMFRGCFFNRCDEFIMQTDRCL
jgi:hypothetical protein